MIKVWDMQGSREVRESAELMELAGLDPRMGFEAVAVQDDSQLIVCDTCGNFGYLDNARYKAVLFIGDV